VLRISLTVGENLRDTHLSSAIARVLPGCPYREDLDWGTLLTPCAVTHTQQTRWLARENLDLWPGGQEC